MNPALVGGWLQNEWIPMEGLHLRMLGVAQVVKGIKLSSFAEHFNMVNHMTLNID